MSENTTPANDSATAAASSAAKNDNATVNSKSTEATAATANKNSDKPAKREPKQGVRDVRVNKDIDPSQPASDSSKSNAPQEGAKGAKDDNNDQSEQSKQEKGSNQNSNRRGRRGRKPNEQPQQRNQQQKLRVDPKKVAKKAWSIFLAEVSEEGLALVGDKEGKEFTKRSFKLAELFQEEEERRIQLDKKEQAQAKDAKKAAKKVKKQAKVILEDKPAPKKSTKKPVAKKAKSTEQPELITETPAAEVKTAE